MRCVVETTACQAFPWRVKSDVFAGLAGAIREWAQLRDSVSVTQSLACELFICLVTESEHERLRRRGAKSTELLREHALVNFEMRSLALFLWPAAIGKNVTHLTKPEGLGTYALSFILCLKMLKVAQGCTVSPSPALSWIML